MNEQKILIVEDEQAIREMIKFAFINSKYILLEAATAEQALVVIAEQKPDIILLDWMLPGMSGIDLLKRLRKNDLSKSIPVIMLTAKGNEADKVKGLDVGADDYVSKPFSPRELLARIKALIRRTYPEHGEVLSFAQIKMDTATHRVSIAEKSVTLGPTEYKLLHFFICNPERVFSRGQLLDNVWGGTVYIEDRTVDVHIRRLRKALSKYNCDDLIQTVRGTGYRISAYQEVEAKD